MVHLCKIKDTNADVSLALDTKSRCKRRFVKRLILNEANPLCSLYFRSEMAVRREKLRQLNSGYTHIIHPLSRFREWYEIWLIFLYMLICIFKPLDAITRRGHSWRPRTIFSVILDVISWSDIIINCFTGYINETTKKVELNQKNIILKYVTSMYFIPDILGAAMPRYMLYFFSNKPNRKILGVQILCCLLRPIRIITAIQLIYKVCMYTLVMAKTRIFVICSTLIFLFVLHFVTCMQICIGRIIRKYYGDRESFLKLDEIEQKFTMEKLYLEYIFRSSAYLLGIAIPPALYDSITREEEFIMVILIYLLGKILLGITWIILVQSILNARSSKIKFQGIMNQLDEYMKQKQLPEYLQNRIRQYYVYKYQNEYFKDVEIYTSVTKSLKYDISMDLCKLLVAKVSIFRDLTFDQIGQVVPLLIHEIYLEGDVIIQARTPGNHMYFLATGTVAVYTPSGREVCHLEDGAFFGEISLVLKGQPRTASIVAVESCQTYKLYRKDLEKTLFKDKAIFQKFLAAAEKRLKLATMLEEENKKRIFEKTYTYSSD